MSKQMMSPSGFTVAPLADGSPWLKEIRQLEKRIGDARGEAVALVAYVNRTDEAAFSPASPS